MKIEKQRLSPRTQRISPARPVGRSLTASAQPDVDSPAPRRREFWSIGVILLIGALIAGCSAFSSDTVHIVQQNADGTITAYSGTMTAVGSTLDAAQATAVQAGTWVGDYSTLQAQYGQLETSVNPTSVPGQAAPSLGGQSNGNSQPNAVQPTSAPVASGGNAPTLVPPPPLPEATAADPNAMTMDTPIMSNAIDNQGCAVKPTATFTLKDAKIYVVARVHKLAKGTDFQATWSGSINHTDSWTADRNASVLCVHFYVDPNAINMTAGQWTVSLTMGSQTPQTVNFTIADTSIPATASP